MSKTAIITGGTKGIGEACANRLYSLGYNIAVIYSGDDVAAGNFASDKDMSRVMLIKANVADFEAMQNMGKSVISTFGSVDVLINNAGIASQKMINDVTEYDWDRMFGVNTKGCFNCVKAVIDNMIHNKYGRIINISSMWGQVGASCEVPYSASKAAVIGFTKALAKELAPSGITVNCICPGVIDTQMNNILAEDVLEQLAQETPLGRLGTPEDVGYFAEYLVSEKASFITGQILGVNGGYII